MNKNKQENKRHKETTQQEMLIKLLALHKDKETPRDLYYWAKGYEQATKDKKLKKQILKDKKISNMKQVKEEFDRMRGEK